MKLRKLGTAVTMCLSMLSTLPTQAWAANTYSVLAYHSVMDESAPKEERLYVPQTLTSNQLIAHFNWFKSQGYNIVSWQQIIDAEQGKSTLPERAVVISFDDGYKTMYDVIFPLLKAYNYPAVFAPVSSWINTPMNGKVSYGKEKLDRGKFFATWKQIDEMQNSGLVEIASHTHDLHYGVPANPNKSSLAAMVAPIYKNGKYETEAQYKSRLVKDAQLSSHFIRKYTGIAPRIMVWPYGAFNETAVKIVKKQGMPHHFTLKEKINYVGDAHVGRFLVDAESTFPLIKHYLDRKIDLDIAPKVERTLYVNLDYVYDSDPRIFQKKYDALINRAYKYGVSAVYVKAFSDSNNDGIVDAVYFPNKHLPVRADIFSQIAWQLRTRSEVKVYAWMPSSLENYPTNLRNVETMKDIFKDLSLYSKGDGIYFDDAVNPNQWANTDKNSIDLTKTLKKAMEPYLFFGTRGQSFIRNINPMDSQFVDKLKQFSQEYDRVIIEARPYSLSDVKTPAQAKKWLYNVIDNVKKSGVSHHKVSFDFALVNPETLETMPVNELVSWLKILEQNRMMNVGFYPEKYLFDENIMKIVKPYVSNNTDIRRK